MKKEYDFSNARRGPVLPPSSGKTRITIRIDDDVLEWFRNQVERSGRGSYQTAMNDVLRNYIASSEEALETTLRRVLREELDRPKPARSPHPPRQKKAAAK
jgi:Arc/MetJ family transcription regulator